MELEANWQSKVKEAAYLGRIHKDTYLFSDFDKLSRMKSLPVMKQLDVYHDSSLVFGYEVHYQKEGGGVIQVGHHIGGHLNGGVRCDSLVFMDGEFITQFGVSSGDLVDRIEVVTNLGRHFKAGGPGGGFRQAQTESSNPRFIALGGGLGGHMHNLKAYYV